MGAVDAPFEFQIVNGQCGRLRLREHVFHLAEDGVALRFVLHLRDALKFLQEFALALGQFGRRLHSDLDEQIAFAVPVQDGDAFSAQLENGSRLRAFGNFQHLLAFESWHFNFRANSGLGKRNRNYAVDIVPVTLKEGMFFDVEHKV